MELKVLKKEEKMMNTVMFGILTAIPIVAFLFVLFFNGGSMKDSIVFIMLGANVIIRLLEKRLGKYAKYAYSLIMPVGGAVVIVMGTPGVFGAMVEAYFLGLFLTIPYYTVSVVNIYAAVTVIVNVVVMIIFPKPYLEMYTLTVWVFLWLIFLLAVISAFVIVARARSLFAQLADKENQVKIQINEMFGAVQSLSDNLYNAGNTLSQVSENESDSAEELVATSEQLLKSSNVLSSKTDESMSNLSELSEWENVLADHVEKVGTASNDLICKSTENVKLLNNLQAINGEVSEAMKTTTDIAQKLSDAVEEIGVTLNLINDISSSTNLLALNASIESARAGEAGKGFAVVATEVGNLANNTKSSLEEVEDVIKRVQTNVKEITAQVGLNASKLDTQNAYFTNVFESMQTMTELLNNSASTIHAMEQAHGKQADVIKHTISINQDIAKNIITENEQFTSINTMLENNANDVAEVATQAKAIHNMVNEMRSLLKQE